MVADLDRKLDDIFKIQEEIAAEVVKELRVSLLGAAPKPRTTDPKAYVLYLQAGQLGRQHTAEAFEKSDALYRQALEIDPRYAPAWNGVGRNFVNKSGVGLLSDQEAISSGRRAVEKALAIDPEYAPAYSRLGYISMIENDLPAAARYFERALALDPSDLTVLGNASVFLKSLGHLDQALALQCRSPLTIP